MENSNLLEYYLKFETLLHRYFAWKRREEGPRGNPHRGQGRILSILKLQPEISQKEMTYLLDMRPQSLGELLTKLEKAEFITRKPSETDRRVMIITLTEAGADEAEKMNNVEEKNIFDLLSQEEREQFEAIIAKLARAIKDELPEDAMHSGKYRHSEFGGFEGHRRGFGKRRIEDFHPHGRDGELGDFQGYSGFGGFPHRFGPDCSGGIEDE
ncbi:MarR family transcriptional regulator [Enterococcus sp. BWB1-3]|uniref:MarR family winged helix-turn-helix transcriptional regulator n=1 Tax=unclassified Enterococcus TaxID=2608891 RepID=UPI001920451B|nr:MULTISPECIES: MarR family transcriptional regulator [unclassified Enterococcus]MBL1230130.1 MarR family transcriptional regulator [Enterococcus sp. BWB1-3]MCB5950968.1 MarR family transcriptional regulator [Enterococcus sp. BWT-B8]